MPVRAKTTVLAVLASLAVACASTGPRPSADAAPRDTAPAPSAASLTAEGEAALRANAFPRAEQLLAQAVEARARRRADPGAPECRGVPPGALRRGAPPRTGVARARRDLRGPPRRGAGLGDRPSPRRRAARLPALHRAPARQRRGVVRARGRAARDRRLRGGGARVGSAGRDRGAARRGGPALDRHPPPPARPGAGAGGAGPLLARHGGPRGRAVRGGARTSFAP